MAHPDLDALVDPLFKFAQQMLSKRGSFLPFGASMDQAGTVGLAASHTGDSQPEPNELIELLLSGFRDRAKAGAIRAAGVCVDVRVAPPGASEKTDAICAQLEHHQSQCVDVYLPYRKGWLGFKYGRVFAASREPRIFAPPPDQGG